MYGFFNYIICVFLSFFVLTAQNSLSAQKLQNRELNLYPKAFEVFHKTVFEKDLPVFYVKAPAYNYKLSLKAYTGYPGRPNAVWENISEFRDSVTEQIHSIDLGIQNKEFALEIKIQNNNNQILYHNIEYVSFSDINTQIHIKDLDGNLILNRYLKSDQSFKITHNDESVINFYIKYYSESFLPAPPPASKNSGYVNLEKIGYNQIFTITRGRELKLSEEGLFYILTDSFAVSGVGIGYYGEDFPKMTRINDLVSATRYITKNEEYNRMSNSSNMKAELDAYWLARNKKETEARRLISLYYNRMQTANRLFSTCKEGWKTDMGMLYTIFGSPDIVRKFSDKTIWYYSYQNNRSPVEFVFINYNGQTVLDRSSNLKEPWNAEIMNWRLGRAN